MPRFLFIVATCVASPQFAPSPAPRYEFEKTGDCLDLAIEGRGYFQVTDNDKWYYTRIGNFRLNDINLLETPDGLQLDPAVGVFDETIEIVITDEGRFRIRQACSTLLEDAGAIELAIFPNPAGLRQVTTNLFEATDASGPPTMRSPGVEGRGLLKQGYLQKLPKR